jgi:hypothetical protein
VIVPVVPLRMGRRHHWLRAVFLALLLTPVISATMAAPTSSSREPRRSQPARFSDLAELTPANVHGLLPLVSRVGLGQFDDQGVIPQRRSTAPDLQVDSLATADLRLQHFLDERVRLQLAAEEPARLRPLAGAAGSDISYVIGMPAAFATPAPGVPEARELRAWDPIERRVVWSVTETLPISARALVTAGGLVFYGTTDGWLKALDARTGRTLWKYRAEGKELAEPFSYRGTDGHQYIAVHSRPHAAGSGGQTLLIFALAH